MTMNVRTYLGLFIVLLIGIVIGRLTDSSAKDQSNPVDTREASIGKTRRMEAVKNLGMNNRIASLRQEIRSAPADQCGRMLYQSLEVADPFERRPLLDELFARMDADNFIDMIDALNRMSAETGRSHYDEWLLVHERSGQVAGPQAMARFVERNKLGEKPAERALFGWATVNPQAAREWLDEHPDLPASLRDQMLGTIMGGATIHNPSLAISMLESLPESERVDKVGSFVSAFVQHQGKDRMIEWLATVRASEPESGYSQALAREVFDKTIWAGANQSNADVMVSDLELLASIIPIDQHWINRSMGQIRDRKITGGIDLVDRITRSDVLSRIPIGDPVWSDAVGDALSRDPAAVAEWLSENPDSPIHSVVSSMWMESVQ